MANGLDFVSVWFSAFLYHG